MVESGDGDGALLTTRFVELTQNEAGLRPIRKYAQLQDPAVTPVQTFAIANNPSGVELGVVSVDGDRSFSKRQSGLRF